MLFIGENPLRAVQILIQRLARLGYGIGFTLYYATNFVFTGLAVAVAFHAGLFNIGGEGQASLGGLGVTLVCLALPWPHWSLALPARDPRRRRCSAAAWAFMPGYLQAKRGSHIVITTIMFNFIASALMVYLLVNVLKAPGSMAPETANFPEGALLPFMHEMLGAVGITMSQTPLNLTSLLALVAAFLTWVLIWRTRLGYEIRTFGFSEPAAVYAGIDPARITIIVMVISGALAGMMALNVVMGVQHRLVLDFVGGAGFVGIAVALMGRSHPVGMILAAILFGMLYQGGAELAFEMPEHHPRDDRGDPGAGDPVHRRAGEHGARRRSSAPSCAGGGRPDGSRHHPAAGRLEPAARDAAAARLPRRALLRARRHLRHRARGQDARRRLRRRRGRRRHRLGLARAARRHRSPRSRWR